MISSINHFNNCMDMRKLYMLLAMVAIYNPKGIYYGGTVAAPVIKTVFENILPYLGIEKASE